jgi:thioredoxin-like negative regulator of GroEL
LAQVLLERSAAAKPWPAAREAIDLLDALGSIEEGEALLRLVYAEALHAERDPRAASAILDAKRPRPRARSEDRRRASCASFLERVRENSRTLALAASFLRAPLPAAT